MYRFLFSVLCFIGPVISMAQVASFYTVSFENALHHEAQIKARFTNLKSDKVQFRMSRSSPGRYALHEFAKNVYNVEVTDGEGKVLEVTRTDPYSWSIRNHNGTLHVSYTLFANHGDGTYAQVDETHAHLNAPATFIYVPELTDKEIEVTFDVREDLNWKVATQLKQLEGNTYYAKDFQYLMDSPVEISDFKKRSFQLENQTVSFVLHDHMASEENFDQYFENVKKIVLEQKAVFGELPTFDFGEYTFLACYVPNVAGDGMEHRNSTVVTNARSLAQGGVAQNIGTVSHEFFHCWNVERIRPLALEPFDFTKANMSGELWFAEGFTNYYDALTLCRAGIWSKEAYLDNMQYIFNQVWTAPGRQFFSPIEMSQQAPFVDAAKSVDETNRENTFISYYIYGEMLGLALDLSLREIHLNLDDYMKLVWNNYGKVGKHYTIDDLKDTLMVYAGSDFGNYFFSHYIFKSGMPDFERLFKNVGINLKIDETKVNFGATVRHQKLMDNPKIGSMAYAAGLQKGDKILKIGSFILNDVVPLEMVLNKFSIGDHLKITIQRHDSIKEFDMSSIAQKTYELTLMDSKTATENMLEYRALWLNAKQ